MVSHPRSSVSLGQTQIPNSPFPSQDHLLLAIPLADEITKNVLALHPLKAPGPNGYHAIFFQKNWHIISPSVIQIIQKIFENQVLAPDWGVTNLILIPKVASPDMITQFQLISLCNSIYKVVSRIILHRLKPFIATIINLCQVGFVPGHQTSDNIILA